MIKKIKNILKQEDYQVIGEKMKIKIWKKFMIKLLVKKNITIIQIKI